MYEVDKLPQSIDIGYTGEIDFRTVQIDMSAWVDKVPGGTPTLMHIRPGEYNPYPVEITYANNVITWSVSDEDLGTREGTGLLQVWFGVQDEAQVMRQLGMSVVVPTIIHMSIAGEGRNSSTVQIPWLKEVMELKNIILGYDYEAESWANGKRGGVDVENTDPAYHNNAKYYKEQVEDMASDSEAFAAGTRGGEDVDEDDPAYENNAKYYNEQAALEKAAAQAAAETASAAYNVNLLAANYDATKTYAVGEYVIYSGGLYRCISAITTAEAWTAAHWSSVTVGKDTSALKSAIDGELYAEDFAAAIEKGKYWSYSDGTSANSNKYARTISKEIEANGKRNAVGLVSDAYTFGVQCFDSSKAFMYSLPYGSGITYIPKEVYYFGLSFKKNDNTNISDTDKANIQSLLKFYKASDNTLKQSNEPADADAVGQMFAYSSNVTPIPLHEGYYLEPSSGKLVVATPKLSSAGWSYGIVPCVPNDKFCVNGESYNGTYPLAWYFLDDEYNIIVNEAQNVTVTNKILNAPADAAYFVVHTKNPKVLSFKGSSVSGDVAKVATDIALFKQGKEPFEMGTINDTTGYVATSQGVNRIRSCNFLSLKAYNHFALFNSDYGFYLYAYDSDYDYLGSVGTSNKQEWFKSEIVDEFSTAVYIKIVVSKVHHESDNITADLPIVQNGFICNKIEGGGSSDATPELSDEQKAAIKTLADDYYARKADFNYLSSATMNAYASSSSVKTSGKYKICCSLLASLLWMGRSADDFPALDGEGTYSNAVTQEFDFGYYFAFAERALYNLKPEGGYYGFVNQFDDADYAGSYSWNSYYLRSSNSLYHQKMNEFMYANDMAKEMDRLGYTIPMSELQTGDLIFTAYPAFDPKDDTFDAIAYKHINHVAIVYEKTDSGITIIESTPRFSDAIHKSSSTGTDEEKVRIAYLLGTAVCFARHPAAWGNGGNVPSTITSR